MRNVQVQQCGNPPHTHRFVQQQVVSVKHFHARQVCEPHGDLANKAGDKVVDEDVNEARFAWVYKDT